MTEEVPGVDDETHEMDRDAYTALEREVRPAEVELKPRIRPVRFTIKTMLFIFVIYCFISLVPEFLDASRQLRDLNPVLVAIGFGLQLTALFCS